MDKKERKDGTTVRDPHPGLPGDPPVVPVEGLDITPSFCPLCGSGQFGRPEGDVYQCGSCNGAVRIIPADEKPQPDAIAGLVAALAPFADSWTPRVDELPPGTPVGEVWGTEVTASQLRRAREAHGGAKRKS